MTALADRQAVLCDIALARAQGARLSPACAVAGIDRRTWRRWQAAGQAGDRRPGAVHPAPAHALSPAERQAIVETVNEPRFAALPPAQIVPRLADEGRYLASESSFYRVLRQAGQAARRGRARPPQPGRVATTHHAARPGEVWCWDVTWLPSRVKGQWYYLYLILDLYSRKIVAHEVQAAESGEHAAQLLKRAALAEGVHAAAVKPVLHGDNGAALKGCTVLAMLHWLGIAPSYSRPRVSDDNAYVESLFRTAKYRPGFPAAGFASLEQAREWAAGFTGWYNQEHRHGGIRHVTPEQRHAGQDTALLACRDALYQQAKERHPRRWSGSTRNWPPAGTVTLNPDRRRQPAARQRGQHSDHAIRLAA